MAGLTQGAVPMTREEKKKWLMRVTRINEEIRELEEMRKTSMERATAITASYSKAAAGSGADPHKFEPVAMAGEIIDKRIRDLQTAIAETLLVINRVQETENMSDKRRILLLRRLPLQIGATSWELSIKFLGSPYFFFIGMTLCYSSYEFKGTEGVKALASVTADNF